MHTPKIELLSKHLRVRIEFLESAEKVEELLPALCEMVIDCVVEIQDTRIVKIARKDRHKDETARQQRAGRAVSIAH